VDHFADAQFAIPANRYDPSEAKQSQALKKYYMNDTGLVNACEFMPPQKRGSLLETLVFLELQKRDMIVNYFSGPNECDFVVQEKGRITEAIQVCYDLTPENRNRESAGVIAAMERFGLKEGLIITQSQENIIESKAGKIHILPAWKWCLDL
jgi:predicted AAA+ superfamily ATPase